MGYKKYDFIKAIDLYFLSSFLLIEYGEGRKKALLISVQVSFALILETLRNTFLAVSFIYIYDIV